MLKNKYLLRLHYNYNNKQNDKLTVHFLIP